MGGQSWIAIIESGAASAEILKITQGQGEGVTAVDKGQLGPLRPNTILEALEESIARRNREGDIWPTFLHSFGLDAASMAECKPRPHQQSATRAMSALGQKQTSRWSAPLGLDSFMRRF